MTRKENFLKAYANVPLALRKEIILVLDETGEKKPITWDVAFLEINNDSPKSENILDGLEKLSLI